MTKFVINPFGVDDSDYPGQIHKPIFDWKKFKKVIHIATRMLDNVVEIANLPLEKQQEEIERKRRHGLGITGLIN